MRRQSHSAPFYSVIIPVFNRANQIGEAIQSVLAQSFQDFEVIVVDDGSQDEPDRVLRRLSDSRVRCIRQENQGSAMAREKGVHAAKGKYIAFLDSDDLFLENKLESVHRALQDSPGAWVYHRYYMDRGNGIAIRLPSRPLRENEPLGEFIFVYRQFMLPSALVVPRHLCCSVHMDPSLRKAEDHDFCLRLELAAGRPVFIPEALTLIKDWSSSGRASRIRRPEDLRHVLEKNRQLLSPRARDGLRATMLSYEISPKEPLLALKFLVVDAFRARVPIDVVVLCALRAFMPSGAYRSLVNWLLRVRPVTKNFSKRPQTRSAMKFRP